MKADIEERYLGEAGYERAAWDPPAGPQQSVATRWVSGLMVAASACFAIGLAMALNDAFGPHEATDRMERILAQLDRMNTIRPETAQAVTRIISQRGYDCEQVACDAKLTARNITVRFRIATALAAKAPPEDVDLAASVKLPGEVTARRRGE